MAEQKRALGHADVNLFPVIGGELAVGQVPLSRLAARVGHSPFYAYSRDLLSQRARDLRAALPEAIKVHYAMKANPMPALVQHMVGIVDGIDVASTGELKIALDAGVDPQHVSFAGPGKTTAELRQAVAAGIMINIESFREVDILASAARQLELPARVSVRVNPDFELKSSGMKMGGGPKQFGVDVEQVPELMKRLSRSELAFEGFHIFAGSQNLRPDAIVEAQRKSFDLITALAVHAPSPIKSINLGGGFGIPYFPGESRLELSAIASNLTALLSEANAKFPDAAIALELGRYLVGEAGLYVCSILDRKVSRGQVFLIVDGGLHHHLAASGNFGQVLRKNYPVAIGNKITHEPTECATVAGPLCTPLDILADRVELPAATPGDLVVVFQSGAYGLSASPQRFLGHPLIPEVLV